MRIDSIIWQEQQQIENKNWVSAYNFKLKDDDCGRNLQPIFTINRITAEQIPDTGHLSNITLPLQLCPMQ